MRRLALVCAVLAVVCGLLGWRCAGELEQTLLTAQSLRRDLDEIRDHLSATLALTENTAAQEMLSKDYTPEPEQMVASYTSPEDILFVSQSEAWDEQALKSLYEELLLNRHGEELNSLSRVTVYPQKDDFAAATHERSTQQTNLTLHFPSLPETPLFAFTRATGVISLYDGDERTTAKEMASSLSHEYGHHYTFTYMLQSSAEIAYYYTEYATLRGLNADNSYVAGMHEKVKAGVKVLTFGIEQAADVKAEAIRTEGNQTLFMVEFENERHEYVLPMVGRHNVYNSLAAIAAGFALGMTAAEIHEGLLSLEATKMRFECQEVGEWHVVNDAYNASPMSMKAAIETLADLVKEGRKIAVMGDMLELGDVEEEAHRQVGFELAAHGFNAVVTRGRLGALIAEGAKDKGSAEAYTCASHEEAAAKLKEILQPGDTVLFKGSRGMQMEKIIDLLK